MSRSLFYTFLGILCIKGIFLLVDSQPAYFFGDSASYLATATVRWIPPDRSFLYGLLLRRIAYHTHWLESMIWTQVLLSAIAAWLLCFALTKIFSARFGLAAIFGILCAVEPLQLLAERYVMTDSSANFLFALHFVLVLLYVKRGRLWILLAAQVAGVLLISFRISFLPAVLADSVLAPLLAPHAIGLLRVFKEKPSGEGSTVRAGQIWLVVAHLCLSLLVSQGLLTSYKRWYGRLTQREPALLYEDGAFLVSDFAPLIESEDFPIPSKRAAVFSDLRFDRHDLSTRPLQHFGEGGLWPNIRREFPDEKQANDLAAATAMHALFRNPAGAVRLAFQTFLGYFDSETLQGTLMVDEGADNNMTADTRDWLQHVYGVSDPRDYQMSVTKKWHQLALPWYWLVLCSLVLSPLLFLVWPRSAWPLMIACTVAALILLEGATLTVDRPTPRFLTSAAWMVLLLLGLAVNRYTAKTGALSPSFTILEGTRIPR